MSELNVSYGEIKDKVTAKMVYLNNEHGMSVNVDTSRNEFLMAYRNALAVVGVSLEGIMPRKIYLDNYTNDAHISLRDDIIATELFNDAVTDAVAMCICSAFIKPHIDENIENSIKENIRLFKKASWKKN